MSHQLRFLICCLAVLFAPLLGIFVAAMAGANPFECLIVGFLLGGLACLIPAASFALSVLDGMDALREERRA